MVVFCRKCGNELMDTDVYCSKCGVKIEVPTSKPEDINVETCSNEKLDIRKKLKIQYNDMNNVLKFFVCLIILTTIVSMIYAALLPPHLSVLQFITDSRGLSAVVSFSVGSAIIPFVFVVPILNNMVKSGMIKKPHKIEMFFFMVLLEVIADLIGRSHLSYPLMIHFIVPIILLIILMLWKLKKKIAER